MQLPEWTKPGLPSGVIGNIASATVGFSAAGWSIGGLPDKMARLRAGTAAISALGPSGVAMAWQPADAAPLSRACSNGLRAAQT